jgi:hypothetical protein
MLAADDAEDPGGFSPRAATAWAPVATNTPVNSATITLDRVVPNGSFFI